MLTIKSITNGLAFITIDVDGTNYAWTVGDLADIADVQTHLEANADTYRVDVRTALEMGRVLDVIPAPTLADVLAAKSAGIQAEKCRVRDTGFDVDGVHFDGDYAARLAYAELADILRDTPTYSVRWRASENVWVTMDATLYAKVKAAGTVYVQAAFAWQGARDSELAAVKSAVAAGTMSTPDALTAVAAVSDVYGGQA